MATDPSSSIGAPTQCRACGAEVRTEDPTCAACGAARPALAVFSGEGYEWRSRATWMGSPVVHVAFGMDAVGKPRVARGVVAIGQRAIGGVAVGIMATGFVSFGVIAFGVFSGGVVAVAALAACGVNAFAPCAVGVFAAGYWAGGVATWGWRSLFP